MEQMTAKKVRERFKAEWPDLTQIWLRNKKYSIPTPEELSAVVGMYVDDTAIIGGFNECENKALYLHAAVKKHWVINGTVLSNWAFGDFICKRGPLDQIHTACVCLTTEGFYFIEPMENNRAFPASDDYQPFFINLM